MHIYLDTRDHIKLTERFTSEEANEFESLLRDGGHRLVFSMHNIIECCVPLNQSGNMHSVTRALNRLEKIPHLFIAEAKIPAMEFLEAGRAFLGNREYRNVDPFVGRFDEVVSPFHSPPTSIYLSYGLSQIIFELWQEDPGLFNQSTDAYKKLAELMESDRSRKDYRQHEINFSQYVHRTLDLFKIEFPRERIVELSEWIWADPNRCPASRLSYETYHKITRNITDKGEISDIPDFAHVDCVNYVDTVTLDRRIRGYISQVDTSINTNYCDRICKDINEVKALLMSKA